MAFDLMNSNRWVLAPSLLVFIYNGFQMSMEG